MFKKFTTLLVSSVLALGLPYALAQPALAQEQLQRYTCMQEKVATKAEADALKPKVEADTKKLCSQWSGHFAEVTPFASMWKVTGYGYANPDTNPLESARNECEIQMNNGGADFDFEACIDELLTGASEDSTSEPVQIVPPPPPCWSGQAGNNCPVGGALRFAAPKYAMVGVPVTMYAYASWRPDENSPAQPTNGTAVIRVDGEDYSGVEFVDGIASWRFIPETEGVKEFTASGVVFSGLSGASAYIDTVQARTYVLEYDPAAYAGALKNKLVEVGERYVITDPNQAKSYLGDRYTWRVSGKSEDVCAVYETKRGTVKAKFNQAGECKVIWVDTAEGDKGNFTFIAEK